MIRKLLDLLWPINARCVACGEPAGAEEGGLCEACLSGLQKAAFFPGPDRCPNCGALRLPDGSCGVCEAFGGTIACARFAYTYRGTAENEIHAFKYSGMGCLAETMAKRMYASEEIRKALRDCSILVPAPIDRRRRTERGYNQAGLLAKVLGSLSGKPVQDILIRDHAVQHQAHLNRAERLKNLSGLIRCETSLQGRRVALIDDVRTTGATAAACAKVLRVAGAEAVVLLTYAGTDNKVQ